MKQRFLSFFLVLLFILGVAPQLLAQCVYTTTRDGNFYGDPGVFAVTGSPVRGGGSCPSTPIDNPTTAPTTTTATIIIKHKIILNGDLTVNSGGSITIQSTGSLIQDGTARSLTINGGALTIDAVTSRTVARLTVSSLTLTNTGATGNTPISVTVGNNSAIQVGCFTLGNQGGLVLGNNALLNVSRDVIITNGNGAIQGPTAGSGAPAGIRVEGNFRGVGGGTNNVYTGTLITCYQQNQSVTSCSADAIQTPPTGTGTTNDPSCRSVLPVTLASFTASRQSSNVYVKWATATEKNNAYFEIQRSNDGKSFTTIGKVAGNGTTATGASYSFSDRNPLAAASYYRLRQVDNDATETYSSVVAVSGTDKIEASFYPNPSNSFVTLPAVSGLVKYRVYTATGQSIATGEAQGGSEINLQKVPTGIYFLELISADKHNVQRFVKQ